MFSVSMKVDYNTIGKESW